jgi:energy-coupling factor transporter transmembrane protein EcfT
LVFRSGDKNSLIARLRAAAPIFVFAGLLALMQWISTGAVTLLPLETIAVFLLVKTTLRILPWRASIFALRPRSWLYTPLLFALFVGHFVAIFGMESRRVLTARSLCLSRSCGRGSLRSLVFALAALFSRTLLRAERFYAAQRLRGLAE